MTTTIVITALILAIAATSFVCWTIEKIKWAHSRLDSIIAAFNREHDKEERLPAGNCRRCGRAVYERIGFCAACQHEV